MAHNLPVPLTSLVGRVAETDAVMAFLDERRLVTLLGEGGCGKTRLALRVASAGLGHFVDGVWLVDPLRCCRVRTSCLGVAQVLGLQGGLDDVVSALEHQEVLLVLDNCEHVRESTAALVTLLLSECGTVKEVATSRVPLDVPGKTRYHVPPLEVPRAGADMHEAEAAAAVQLFCARADLARPGYRLGAWMRTRSSSSARGSTVSHSRSSWQQRGCAG